MEKQINNIRSLPVKIIVTVIISCSMLSVLDASVPKEPTKALKAVSIAMESKNGVESRIYVNAKANNEAVKKYNAEGYVRAEMELEIQNWINETETNNEAIEAELAHQFEAQLNNNKYNPEEFVNVEMANEIESRANNVGF